ncbi:nucleoside-triphosphatase [Rosettibacter firmus]|uniref:nucleoside-triphosphatase n=1 Tax=Rosettibacter firmus TaxID=3111522 RepID=UPI00336C05DF
MKNKIYIITGLSKTGKTTRLMNWALNQKSIDGILQPVVDGKRCFYHISSRTLMLLGSDDDFNTIKVGKYKFNQEAFKWANEKLINTSDKNYEWLVIDEIGLLELQGKGLDKSIKIILKNSTSMNLIFVIRESLLNKALQHYNIKDYQILEL